MTATLRNMEPDRWHLGDQPARPLRAMGAIFGDLADLGLSARWIGIPASAIGAPHHRFRVFILAHSPVRDTTRFGLIPRRGEPRTGEGSARDHRAEPSDHRPNTERTAWLTDAERRVRDTVVPDRGHLHRWGRYAGAIARWEHIIGREAPAPALLTTPLVLARHQSSWNRLWDSNMTGLPMSHTGSHRTSNSPFSAMESCPCRPRWQHGYSYPVQSHSAVDQECTGLPSPTNDPPSPRISNLPHSATGPSRYKRSRRSKQHMRQSGRQMS